MSKTRVSIKGTKDGLLITLGKGDLTDCLAELGALLRDKASFFKGISEISVVPGATGRIGVSFEYSTSDITIHALETGLSLDIFPKRIEIMATDVEENDFFFVTFFVSYRFGKVVDASGIIDADGLFR